MLTRPRPLAGLAALLAAAVTVPFVPPAASAALAPVRAVAAAPSGQWKVDCQYVKSAADDPIVFPNQPGAAHLHDFFGNVGISAHSTYQTLAGVTSTCATNDRSSYWVPSLYRNGKKVDPSSFIVYYENRAKAGTRIEPFPPGFRMVFGDQNATKQSQVDVHIQWGCSDNSQITAAVPAACGSGAIQLRIQWPSCWDGRTNNGDATGHVSFLPGGVCAAPRKALPTMRTNIVFPVGTTTGEITLSSGSPYSVHGDFFNAWDQATLTRLVDECLNGGKDCGRFRGTSPGKAAPAARTPTAPGGGTDAGTGNAGSGTRSATGGAKVKAGAAASPHASHGAHPDPTPASAAATAGTVRSYVEDTPAGSAPDLLAATPTAAATPTRSRVGYLVVAVLVVGTGAVFVLRRRRAPARA